MTVETVRKAVKRREFHRERSREAPFFFFEDIL